MSLNALLMCRDQRSLQVLAAGLNELGIRQEVCLEASDAMSSLVQGHYSAVVLDFDLPAAAQVARLARMIPSQRRPVVFAMIAATTEIAATYDAGANFVIYKPLEHEQVLRSLRAGSGFMRPDGGSRPRHQLDTLVYLQFGVAAVPALVLDLNGEGLDLQAADYLPTLQAIKFRFVLPATDNMVEGTGEIIWADDEGRAGILFSELSSESRKHLRNWLSKRTQNKRRGNTVVRMQKTRAAPSLTH